MGLKGQLGKLKRTGKRTSTANISKKNEEQMYEMVSKKLKNKTATSKVGISRQDKKKIMHEAYQLTKQKGSKFSKEDMKDLRKVVDKLKNMSDDNILSNTRQDNISKEEVNSTVDNNINNNGLGLVGNFSNIKKSSQLSNLSRGSTSGVPNDTLSSDVNQSKHNISVNDTGQDDDIPNPSEAKDLPI